MQPITSENIKQPDQLRESVVKILFGRNNLYMPNNIKFVDLLYTEENKLYATYRYSGNTFADCRVCVYTEKQLVENNLWNLERFGSVKINDVVYFGVVCNAKV